MVNPEDVGVWQEAVDLFDNDRTFSVGDVVGVSSPGMWAHGRVGRIVRAEPNKDPLAPGAMGENYGDRQYTVQIGERGFEANSYELTLLND